MSGKTFYITTTLPYVNAEPHIGFAQEIISADVIARFHQQLLGETVIFNTGTDEHGQKIWQKAKEAGISPQEYCDQYAAKFADLKTLLNLSYNHFIRTTDPKHLAAAQAFWQKCKAQGDIYKAQYQVKYCVGCELAKTESELVDGHCPLHPNLTLEIREEENYFFRFSRYASELLAFYQQQPQFVKPASRMKEIVAFVENGLTDFSISRLKKNMPWGIAVPDDPDHVMYVWFDALVNYISTLGWPAENSEFTTAWPGVQLAGKDNLRQQAAMWQAMLSSAGIAHSSQILINGFIGVNGQKMSKSLGNVISPKQLVDRYGQDASRFLLINLGPFAEDMDVSLQKLDMSYQASLANGIGNLCSRLAKMAATSQLTLTDYQPQLPATFQRAMQNNEIKTALEVLKTGFETLDKTLATQKPWILAEGEKKAVLVECIKQLLDLNLGLQIVMPTIAATISEHFLASPIQYFKTGLFPRLQ